MRNTSVLDIASHIGIGATLIGDDLEEGGTSGPRSAEHEDHLTWPQNTRVPRKKVRMQRRCSGLKDVLVKRLLSLLVAWTEWKNMMDFGMASAVSAPSGMNRMSELYVPIPESIG